MAELERIRATDLLKIKSFRLLVSNSILFTLVQSTERFAYVWMALELGSKSDVNGLLLFMMGIPALFLSLPIGMMSDRLNRRVILMTSQLGALVVTVSIATMISTGHMTLRWAIVGSFCAGIFIAIGSPIRSAIVPTLVPRDKLIGAISVSAIGTNIAMFIGPATAGPAIRAWGIQGVFWVQAVLHLIGFLVLIPLKLPERTVPVQRKMREEIFEGINFIRRDKAVRSFYALLASSVLLMMTPWLVLATQIAKEEVRATASQTTLIFAMMGAGTFISSLLILRFSHKMIRKGMWFMCGLCWGSVVQMILGQSRSLLMMGFFIFLWGLGGGLFMNLNQTLIQKNTPPELMGRVMAITSLLMTGLAPMGALLIGFIARRVDSAPWTFTACGLVMLCISVYFVTTKKHLRVMA